MEIKTSPPQTGKRKNRKKGGGITKSRKINREREREREREDRESSYRERYFRRVFQCFKDFEIRKNVERNRNGDIES